MFILKKEFAGAKISVGRYRIDITSKNVNDAFVQRIISETKGIHHMFESVKSEPAPRAESSRGTDKNES
jgi:hypothetical protein